MSAFEARHRASMAALDRAQRSGQPYTCHQCPTTVPWTREAIRAHMATHVDSELTTITIGGGVL